MKIKTKNPALNALPKLKTALGGSFFLLFFSLSSLTAQSAPSPEYQVKAVFLYNFTQFVEWPASAFNHPDAPFVIGVLGPNPFGAYLDETVAGEKVMGHPLVVQQYWEAKDVKNCHILFINTGDPSRVKDILSGFTHRSMLTVSDSPDFARLGGIVRFFTRDNKIRFQINPGAAKSVNLIISSKLLRVAEIFDTNNP